VVIYEYFQKVHVKSMCNTFHLTHKVADFIKDRIMPKHPTNYRKVLFFRAGKKCNMLLFARRKRSQIKTPNILCKNILDPFSFSSFILIYIYTTVFEDESVLIKSNKWGVICFYIKCLEF
jgi:hypothetical protein